MLSEEALLSPPATDEASPTGMIQEEAAPAPKAESSPPSQAESNPPSQAQSNPPSQDESGGTGTEAKPAKTIVRSTQRAEYADYLSATGDALAAIFAANEPLRTYLAEQGLTAEFLAARQSIFDVALASIETRQAAMAAFAAAVEDQERAESLARTSYVAFRKIAHRTLTSYTARLALRLQQRVPGGLKEFVDSARQVLATAKTEPYITHLALVAMGPIRSTARWPSWRRLNSCTTGAWPRRPRPRKPPPRATRLSATCVTPCIRSRWPWRQCCAAIRGWCGRLGCNPQLARQGPERAGAGWRLLVVLFLGRKCGRSSFYAFGRWGRPGGTRWFRVQ